MSMAWEAWRDQQDEGYETPDEPSKTPATDYMLDEGEHDIIFDLLRGMLAKQGMSGDDIDAALEGECAGWLRDQQEQWWER